MRRWWLAILSMIVAFVVLVGTTVIPFDNGFRSLAQMQPASETHQLRELAESLLVYPFPTLFFRQELKVQLLPGQLPSVPLLNLPMPPTGRLIGSAVYRLDNEEIAIVDILVQAPEPAEDIINFYRRSLPPQGWQIKQSEPLPPGFHQIEVGKFPVGINQLFCQEKLTEPWRNFGVSIVSPKTNEPNNVRINLLTQAFKKIQGENSSTPCDQPPEQERPEPENAYQLIPSFSAPIGVEFKATSTCSSGGLNSSVSTIAKTNQDAVELEASIADQLEAAGWKRVTGHAEKPLAWSIWQIPAHSKSQGVLLAIESPNENEYLISVEVTSRKQLNSP